MPPQRIRAIISDIGRVIVGVDVSRAMQGLSSGIALTPKEIWSAIENDPRFPDLQDGRISARDWHLHIVRRLGGNLTYDQFIQAWNAALLPETLQPDSLWAGLAKKYRLSLLSNTDPIHVAHMESTFSFFKYFPVRIYSCVVGSSKPNPVIYQEALRATKVKANESVYIDDLQENVAAAQSLGMIGVHCAVPAELVSRLKSAGVDVP
ncbi:MAG TPA: HAD-IA family hydrolase [Candidatus Acidoferrum sp.]|nr:HAD-IA family hydrolase [Candidatus Acidoferrum sp.]